MFARSRFESGNAESVCSQSGKMKRRKIAMSREVVIHSVPFITNRFVLQILVHISCKKCEACVEFCNVGILWITQNKKSFQFNVDISSNKTKYPRTFGICNFTGMHLAIWNGHISYFPEDSNENRSMEINKIQLAIEQQAYCLSIRMPFLSVIYFYFCHFQTAVIKNGIWMHKSEFASDFHHPES